MSGGISTIPYPRMEEKKKKKRKGERESVSRSSLGYLLKEKYDRRKKQES